MGFPPRVSWSPWTKVYGLRDAKSNVVISSNHYFDVPLKNSLVLLAIFTDRLTIACCDDGPPRTRDKIIRPLTPLGPPFPTFLGRMVPGLTALLDHPAVSDGRSFG